MPTWARRYYTEKIVEFKQEEKKQYDAEMKKAKSKGR